MIMIKIILLVLVFLGCTYIGTTISNQYKKRVEELKEMKKSFIAIETKMKYTYDILPEIFKEISIGLKENIKNVFEKSIMYMEEEIAQNAWVKALENTRTNMSYEDIEILKGFGKLLGKTDIEGQVSQIELTNQFLEIQIKKAEDDFLKNDKLYKTLGTISGLAIVIILI